MAYGLCFQERERLVFEEVAYGDIMALGALLHHCAQMGFEQIVLGLPAEQDISFLPFAQSLEEEFVMMRIVDLRALSLVTDALEGDYGVIQVLDDKAPWNEGVFLAQVKEGFLRFIPTDQRPQGQMDCNRLAAIIGGYPQTDGEWPLLLQALPAQRGYAFEKY